MCTAGHPTASYLTNQPKALSEPFIYLWSIYLSNHPSKSGPNSLMSWSWSWGWGWGWVEPRLDAVRGVAVNFTHKEKGCQKVKWSNSCGRSSATNKTNKNRTRNQHQQQQRHTLSMSLLVALHRKQHPAPPPYSLLPPRPTIPPGVLAQWATNSCGSLSLCAALEMELLLLLPAFSENQRESLFTILQVISRWLQRPNGRGGGRSCGVYKSCMRRIRI